MVHIHAPFRIHDLSAVHAALCDDPVPSTRLSQCLHRLLGTRCSAVSEVRILRKGTVASAQCVHAVRRVSRKACAAEKMGYM
mmetsp:Transcript_99117/g.275998  ORF Transcript_99117/g.275998 Transcript_99117/m.275998 type:complete len:82 (-) Transcript_99117:1235-1480(-)